MLLYIDPGTGSMLITILLGIIGTAVYLFKNIWLKLKFVLTRGRQEKSAMDKLPIVFFTDDKRYWNVFKPVIEELSRRGLETYYYTASEADPALDQEYEHVTFKYIGSGNKAYSFMNLINAYVVVSTTPSLDVFQWKRSREADFYVHMLHAASDASMYRMFGIDYYDAIMISGEYQGRQVRELERLRHLPEKELPMVGIPYMDEMLKRVKAAEKSDASGDEASGKKTRTVLLAPSWGASGILTKYGESFLKALKDTGYNIIVRPHPQSFTSEKEMIEGLMAKFPDDGDKFRWDRSNDNFDVLKNSDIMISDFSGVIFDYALIFDKPFIYTASSYDKSPYDCDWIDEELWTYSILPHIGIELAEDQFGNMKKVIDECISSDKLAAGRDKAREETWQYMGEGTKRVVDYLEKKYKELADKGDE